MTKQEIIAGLRELIDSDISVERKIVLAEAISSIETKVTLEEWTQIVLLLGSLLIEMRKT